MQKRILIIDDDEDILEVLSLILQNEGYQVILANDETAAGNLLAINPDLVLLDLRLAGSQKGGAEICAEIKSAGHLRHLPVVLISAEENVHHIAQECGANAYVQKPFDIRELLTQVSRLVA
jgi:DNA-binding response OmpR family regulator